MDQSPTEIKDFHFNHKWSHGKMAHAVFQAFTRELFPFPAVVMRTDGRNATYI